MADIRITTETINDIDLIIFDKDGTLIDVHQYWMSMVELRAGLICQRLGLSEEHELALMDQMGVDLYRKKIKPLGPVGIKKREIVMSMAVNYLLSMGFSDQTLLCTEVFKSVDEMSLNRLDIIIKPLNGLYDLIKKIKETSCKIAIATTDLSVRASIVVEYLGLVNDIDFIAGGDMVSQNKPHPEMIELILQNLAISRGKAVMIGDAITDIRMGIKAGLKASIGVVSGLTEEQDLRAHTPYVIPDISSIEIGR